MIDTTKAAVFCEACEQWRHEARCFNCDAPIDVSADTICVSHPWQTTLPTAPGFYLWKLPDVPRLHIVLHHVSVLSKGNGEEQLWVDTDGTPLYSFEGHGVWKGPIDPETL